jgi:hypothetical protein
VQNHCSNNPSHAHSQSPLSAQTNALKGQTPSAEGTALGNEAHNKTRPNGAKALIPNSSFINFCYTPIEITSKTLSLQKEKFSVWSRR